MGSIGTIVNTFIQKPQDYYWAPGIEGILRAVIARCLIPLCNLFNPQKSTARCAPPKEGRKQKMTGDLENRKSNPGRKKK